MIFCVLFVLSPTFVFSPLNLILFCNCVLFAKLVLLIFWQLEKAWGKLSCVWITSSRKIDRAKALPFEGLSYAFLTDINMKKSCSLKSSIQVQYYTSKFWLHLDKKSSCVWILFLCSSLIIETAHVQICRTKGKSMWTQMPLAQKETVVLRTTKKWWRSDLAKQWPCSLANGLR